MEDALLHALYERADLFVHPTHYEGSSLVTLEAMAHGRAVVATRAGGIPDKVKDGVTGLLVEPADRAGLAAAIGALAGDGARREAMGAAGRRCVGDAFAWSVLIDRTLALYEELCRRGPRMTRERALTLVAGALAFGLALVVITGRPKGLPAVALLAAGTAGALVWRTWQFVRRGSAGPGARRFWSRCSSCPWCSSTPSAGASPATA